MMQCNECDYRRWKPTPQQWCLKRNTMPLDHCSQFVPLPKPIYEEPDRYGLEEHYVDVRQL